MWHSYISIFKGCSDPSAVGVGFTVEGMQEGAKKTAIVTAKTTNKANDQKNSREILVESSVHRIQNLKLVQVRFHPNLS